MFRSAVGTGRRRGPLSRTVLALTSCLGLFLVSGCGLLSGSEGNSAGGDSAGGMTTINVGTMPAVDVAPLHLAMQRGYFEQAGIKIKTTTIDGGAKGIPKLVNGSLEVTFGNWVSFIRAQSKGAVDLKAVSDAYQATKGTFLLMHMPGGEVKKPGDLKGKKIAVNTRANINELLAVATLKTYGLQPQDVEFVSMGFPDMLAALKRGDVAAASMIEPFISQANQAGAKTLVDTAAGPTAKMPIAGYAATQEWVDKHKKVATKFQRVMARAQAEAGSDRNIVEELLPTYTKISPKTASLVTIGNYPTTLDATRLKSVVGLMQRNKIIPDDFKIEPMLFHAPPKK